MKKVVILVLCLFLLTPVASAFSFSDFISNLFGSSDSLTGYAVGAKCKSDKNCGKGETCSKGSCVASVTCGDGTQAGSEECDDGGSNTDTACSASYGSSCTYCTTSCSSVTVQGASCGDGTCDLMESCDSCELDFG